MIAALLNTATITGSSAVAAASGDSARGKATESSDPIKICQWPEDVDGNCSIIVDGVAVAVNKAYLSMHSPIFHRMFYGGYRERRDDRYEIGDVSREEFMELLNVIMPTRKPIDEKNVETLFALADRFMMDYLKRDCVSFLVSPAGDAISSVVLITLAFRYNSEELKSRVSSRLFTLEHIISLRTSPRFDEICDEARVWLFNLMMSRPQSHSLKRVLCNDRCRLFDCSGRCTVCGRTNDDL